MTCTIRDAKSKALISCGDCWFSDAAANLTTTVLVLFDGDSFLDEHFASKLCESTRYRSYNFKLKAMSEGDIYS